MAILGVEAPGRQGVELVKLGPTPRDIMTPAAFENAIRVDMAMGGSTNTVLHIPAIARETGIDIDAEMNDRISRETPRRRYHRNRHSRSDAECSAGKGQSTDSPRRSRPNVS